jgi:hypothetical protein
MPIVSPRIKVALDDCSGSRNCVVNMISFVCKGVLGGYRDFDALQVFFQCKLESTIANVVPN